jgi:Cu-Zn family superoxide dismutase
VRHAAGAEIGTARFTEDATGVVHLTVHVRGISPGLHGLHLHTIGACVAGTTPAFSSAGAHYSPVAKEHGHDNPAGFHAGDLPNVTANAAGVGHLAVKLEQFTLAELADADGTALVLHANEDDRRTNTGPLGPGNSGARIACGVVQGD